jgi:hypothetical protein
LSLIIALLIVALITFLIISYTLGKGGATSAGVRSPIQRAKSVECLAQIKKVEMQVQLYSAEHGRYPENLEAVEGLTDADLRCPVTGKYYLYDAASGRVSCQDHVR